MKKIHFLVLFLGIAQLLHAQQTVGLFQNDSSSLNGYTLFAPNNSNTTFLIDNCGKEINRWVNTTPPGLSAYLLENGNLLRTGRIAGSFNGGGRGGRVELRSWEGDLLWTFDLSTSTNQLHHDIRLLPNGNILMLAWDKISQADAIQAGRNPSTVTTAGLWLEKIIEVHPEPNDGATIVWEWRLADHLIQEFDASKDNYGVVADHPELMDINFNAGSGGGGPGGATTDWVHYNSIDYNESLDQILISSRNFDEIYILDHSTTTQEATTHEGGNSMMGGDFLYRWGNPRAYGRGTTNDRQLFGQHHANWIQEGFPDEGKIMVFNNGFGRPGGNYSSVDIIEPPLGPDGTYTITAGAPFAPDAAYWVFTDSPPTNLYSTNISGAVRLQNGNTLVCEGNAGRFIEVDLDGNQVWEYISPVAAGGMITQGNPANNNAVFRAYRYDPDYPAFTNRDLTPGDPLELNPLSSTCIIYDGSVAAGDLDTKHGLRLMGNPVTDVLRLENPEALQLRLTLIGLNGIQLQSTIERTELIEWPIGQLQAGMYLLQVQNASDFEMSVWKVLILD
ncbi:MAG: aryl-sulfate sulfotransferase [Saprospiraceae bacterium]